MPAGGDVTAISKTIGLGARDRQKQADRFVKITNHLSRQNINRCWHCWTCGSGCLLAKPPELKNDPELYGSMEAVMAWLGADGCNWGYQAKCCGSFLSVARPDVVDPMVARIMDEAVAAGAECIVTACAMCQLNLELRSRPGRRLPVFSIVELLAYGLGSADLPAGFKKHLIDPTPPFRQKKFAN
jgi:heterodisulfide reductase subunit B